MRFARAGPDAKSVKKRPEAAVKIGHNVKRDITVGGSAFSVKERWHFQVFRS